MTTDQPRVARLGRRVTTLGGSAAALVLSTAPLLAPPAAVAHRDPTLAVRLTEVSPVQPDGVTVDVLDSELTYLVLDNPTESPVRALDPDGKPFLEVSADGVYGDLGSLSLGASPRAAKSDANVDMKCCPGGDWVRLSSKPTWIWPDPRLDPVLRDDTGTDGRGLGELTSDAPLATWEVDFTSDTGGFTASGVVERKQVGEVVTQVSEAPADLDVSIIEARPPHLRIRVPAGRTLEILDDDGSALVRVNSEGAVARADSAEYAAHLRAVRLPEEAGKGWVPLVGSGPGRLTWADIRVDYSADLPAQGTKAEGLVINEWSIPVRLDGEAGFISGRSDWTSVKPPVIEEEQIPGEGFWGGGDRTSYLVAGGLSAAVIAAYLVARTRTKESKE